MVDRRTPFVNAGERETLIAFLDYLREAIVVKATGLDAESVRRPGVPSGTTLLGLVKHLTMAETLWFQWSFAGLDVAIPPDALDAADTTASVIAEYRDTIRRNNAIVAAAPDLAALGARHHHDKEPASLRWVLVHMVEETARHAGHADILREQIDGQTGR